VRELAERLAADKDSEADEKAKIAEGFRAVMEYIRDIGYERIGTGHCTDVELVAWKTASQAAQSFLNKASNEASGVLSTALSFLSLYRDPIVAGNTSASDFTIESLMQRRTSLVPGRAALRQRPSEATLAACHQSGGASLDRKNGVRRNRRLQIAVPPQDAAAD
jgi:hypothetical protein